MSDQPASTRKRIRTFADDFDIAKGGSPNQKNEEVKVVAPTEEKEVKKPVAPSAPIPQLKSIPAQKNEESHSDESMFPKPVQAMPSYHELKKQSKKTKAAPKPTVTVKAKKNKKVKKANIGYDATIITDTKNQRRGFFEEVGHSLQEWFKDIKRKLKKRRTPTYVVPDAERRRGVIQRATSKTGAAFSTDTSSLRARIKARQTEVVDETNHETHTSWSPYTDTGYALLEAPEEKVKNVEVTFKKRALPVAPQVKQPEPVEPTPEPVFPKMEVEKEDVSELPKPAPTPVATPTTPSAPTPPLVPAVPANLPVAEPPAPEPEPSKPKKQARSRNQPGFLDRFETNTITLGALAAIVVLLLIALTARVLINVIQIDTEDDVVTVSSILEGVRSTTLLVSSETTDQYPQALIDHSNAGPAGIVETVLISPSETEVSPTFALDLLGLQPSPGFTQSITTLRIATVNNSAPAFVISFIDPETVRGAMLHWEPSLTTDLANLYGTGNTSGDVFTDGIVADTDIRVLDGEDGLIVYGFIDENTLLIAPSRNIFSTIADITIND